VPEGDTIHLTARRLRDALAGHRVVHFELRRDPRGTRLPEPGTEVTAVEARGKHLLMQFADGATLHTHMQLHGRWDVYAPGQRWRRPAHRARAIVEVDDGTTAVCFDAPVAELRRDTTMPTRAVRSLERLGPDLCEKDVDLDAVLTRFDTLAPETLLVDALLDQRVASGIGNIIKTEVCWACRVDPATPIGPLGPDQRRALYETAHRFLIESTARGVRNTYGNGLAVYGKTRRPCPRCRTPIQRASVGASPRITYWCPACQGRLSGSNFDT
jgi:endonuclease-8